MEGHKINLSPWKGFAWILGSPTSLLNNSHSLTTLYPRAMQHIPLCFHPCCVPVLPCDQTVSLLQLGLVTQVLRVMLVLSLQLLCGVGQHPLLSSTMPTLPRECRCCVGESREWRNCIQVSKVRVFFLFCCFFKYFLAGCLWVFRADFGIKVL